MKSKVIALLAPEGSLEATLLFRRADGQFALGRIDARLASAARAAAQWARPDAALAGTAHTLDSRVPALA